MAKPSPMPFLMENRDIILDAYRESGGPAKTWAALESILPQLAKVMSFSTFKQYISVLAAVSEHLDPEKQEIAERVRALEKENESLNKELEEARQEIDDLKENAASMPVPVSMLPVVSEVPRQPAREWLGWSIELNNGCLKAEKRIGYRVYTVSIGKKLCLRST